MEEAGHQHAHHAPATGARWLDISLALSAFFVSLVSLFLAIHNGRTMERLVASNSYPNIDFSYGNEFDFEDGRGQRPAVYLSLVNSGIGPARLRSVELSFEGKPAASLNGLLAICCTQEPAAALPRKSSWSSGDPRGTMIQAGRQLNLFAWQESPEDLRWQRLDAVRGRIGVRVCYCSVFDECYLRDSGRPEPERVKVCTPPTVPYAGD